MRIGCCASMFSTLPDGTGAEAAKRLGELGFDFIELPLAKLAALSDSDFAAVKERVRISGVPCEACNVFFPGGVRLTGPEADHAAALDYTEKALSRAAELGVSVAVFGSGGARRVPEGFPMEEAFPQLARLLRQMAEIARKHGITIVVEPLRRAETNIANNFAGGVRLARETDDGSVAVLVDYYHMAEERDTVDSLLDDGRRFLRHVHFARRGSRSLPASMAEDPDYGAFFDALEAVGYNGRISLEASAGDLERDAPAALRFFRQRFPRD